jgi:hypothetical protein
MAHHKVLSVPVYANDTGDACNSFFDLHDFLSCCFESGVDCVDTMKVGAAR